VRENQREEELDLLHALRWSILDALRWNLLDPEDEPKLQPLLDTVEQRIREREPDTAVATPPSRIGALNP
jgi:hypothetical protein